MEKNKTEHPRSHIFFIFDPEHNVCGPRNGSTEKIDMKSYSFMIYNLRQSMDSNFQIQRIDKAKGQ